MNRREFLGSVSAIAVACAIPLPIVASPAPVFEIMWPSRRVSHEAHLQDCKLATLDYETGETVRKITGLDTIERAYYHEP